MLSHHQHRAVRMAHDALHRAAQQRVLYLLLQRNLVYTGITRGKQLVVLIGQRKALALAVKSNRTDNRFSGLLARLTA